MAFLCIEFIAVFTIFGLELHKDGDVDQNWGTIRLCGYCKAAITLVKYMPQVYLNWKRQSTVGWSLHNVILDFTGGFFSFGQMIARGKFGDSDSGFNIVKFLLAVIAMIFDLIFLFQHYVLYRSAWEQELKISVRQNALERV